MLSGFFLQPPSVPSKVQCIQRVREHAEPIAFHNGERRELKVQQAVFAGGYANYQMVLHCQFRLNLFQYAHGFLTIVLPTVIIAGDVLSGRLEVGRAIQAAGAFAAILSALTVIVENFESLIRFSAGVELLHAFSQALQANADGPADGHDSSGQHIRTARCTASRWNCGIG